ncbi:unnamed protein product [Pseudo-nitzschia multistriata]|uniref:Uncharacterized protein n=1 Tax=Pseudo-nitzschia multistriata TaxID=183589 RepID=A0A448ZCA2_9STRA|nr:unnamed protein product [Pseudo-nitzschia multistriata]
MPVPPDPRDGPGGGRSREGFPPGRDSDSDTDTGETPAVRWVQLLAPSDLPGGYELDVFCDGLVVAAVVPEGGVRAGEAFSVPFLPPLEALAVLVPGAGEEGQSGGETETEPTEATRLLLPENGPGGGESRGEPLGAEASGQRGGGGCCCCCCFRRC